MPNVKEFYTVNGIELATPGYGISSIIRGIPSRKGENVDTPSSHGTIWREKRLNPRQETWSMYVTDVNPSTGAIPSTDSAKRTQFNTNYDTIVTLLGTMAKQLTVTHTRDVDAQRVGYAEVVSDVTIPDHRDLYIAQFEVEVLFPDPRWYATTTSTTSAITYSGSSASASLSASAVGTAPVTAMTITFTSTSSLTNPRLNNLTYSDSTSTIGYTGTIPSGQTVVIDTDLLTLKRNNVNDIANIYRTGTRQSWFELFPTDNNTLQLTATSGTGNVVISYKRAFF